VVVVQDNNTYALAQLDGDLFVAYVNGRFLKNLL
jgi:hypothetical protein